MKHREFITINRFFTADLVNAVSKGKVITPKHLVGLAIHNMTGQKTPVQIMNKLGHSIGYNKVCEIETSLVELVIHKSEEFNVLPLLPRGEGEIIPTFYWVDNFDVKVEKQIGGSGSVNTTHLMAFQGVPKANITIQKVKDRISLHKSRSRRLLKKPQVKTEPTHKVNSNAEPPKFNKDTSFGTHFNKPIDETFLLWVIFRNRNAKDQMVPNFSGWLLKQHENNIPPSSLRQTSKIYLPRIVSKVSEFKTIESYFEYLEKLSKQCNMPYTNITLDVGAAINAFKFLWSNQTRFRNIVIHLFDFHFMKENFQVSTDFYTFLF